MKRAALTALLLLLASPAWATLYYFSDCATGGAGTTGNPYCIDSDTDGTDDFIEDLADGSGTALAAGDTAYLGCGVPIGTGTCTYYLESHTCDGSAGRCIVDPEQSGTAGNLITVTAYCTGGSCATVTLSGDSNNDGAYNEASEPQLLWSNTSTNGPWVPRDGDGWSGHDYWDWDGDPNDDGVPNIIVEKFGERAFTSNRGGTGNIYEGMRIRYIGAGTGVAGTNAQCRGADYPWDCCTGSGGGTCTGDTEAFYNGMPAAFVDAEGSGGRGVIDAQCSWETVNALLDVYSMFVWSRMYGGHTITIRNNIFEHSCVNLFRHNNNCHGANETCAGADYPGLALIENNTFTDVMGIGQGHQGANFTYRGNVARDYYYGISIEEQMKDITIEDNDLGCPGIYHVGYSRGCQGINVSMGDGPTDCDEVDGGTNDCNADNILIRRNKLWGAQAPNALARNAGYLSGGISFTARNQAGTCDPCVIENNMVWYQQRNGGCAYDYDNVWQSPIAVSTTEPITVRGNTIYDASCPLFLAGASHIVRDNAVYDVYNEQDASSYPEIYAWASASGSDIDYNRLKHGATGTADPTLCIAADDVGNCSAGADADYNCSSGGDGLVSSYQTGNACSVCNFVDETNGSKALWNLHLDAADTVCKDIDGASALTEDLDKQSRPQGSATDIGADELVAAGGRRRVVVAN